MERGLDRTGRCRASRRLFVLPQNEPAPSDDGQRPFINKDKDGNMLDHVLQCEWLQYAVNPMTLGIISSRSGGRRLHRGIATSCSCACTLGCSNPVTWDRGPGLLLSCRSHRAMTKVTTLQTDRLTLQAQHIRFDAVAACT